MPKLTDTQLTILANAAKRDNGAVLPAALSGRRSPHRRNEENSFWRALPPPHSRGQGSKRRIATQ